MWNYIKRVLKMNLYMVGQFIKTIVKKSFYLVCYLVKQRDTIYVVSLYYILGIEDIESHKKRHLANYCFKNSLHPVCLKQDF